MSECLYICLCLCLLTGVLFTFTKYKLCIRHMNSIINDRPRFKKFLARIFSWQWEINILPYAISQSIWCALFAWILLRCPLMGIRLTGFTHSKYREYHCFTRSVYVRLCQIYIEILFSVKFLFNFSTGKTNHNKNKYQAKHIYVYQVESIV